MKDPEKMAKRAEMDRRECRLCLFFDMEIKRCLIGMKNCPLADSMADPDKEDSSPVRFFPCSRCPYGQGDRPCVSFCMKKVLKEWREARENPERRELMMHEF